VGLSPEFTVMDESDSADMLGLIRAQKGLSSKEKRFPRKSTIRSIYSRVVNSREPLATVLKKEYPWCVEAEEGLRNIFNTYTLNTPAAVSGGFFVGCHVFQNYKIYAAPMDTNTPYNGRAWFMGGTTFDPSDLNTTNLSEMGSIGFPSQWLLRADND